MRGWETERVRRVFLLDTCIILIQFFAQTYLDAKSDLNLKKGIHPELFTYLLQCLLLNFPEIC